MALQALIDALITPTKLALGHARVALGEGSWVTLGERTVGHDVALLEGLRLASLQELLGVSLRPLGAELAVILRPGSEPQAAELHPRLLLRGGVQWPLGSQRGADVGLRLVGLAAREHGATPARDQVAARPDRLAVQVLSRIHAAGHLGHLLFRQVIVQLVAAPMPLSAWLRHGQRGQVEVLHKAASPQSLLHVRSLLLRQHEGHRVRLRHRRDRRVVGLASLVLYVELAAVDHLGRPVVRAEPLMLALHLVRLEGPPLRVHIPLPPQLPLDRVELGVKLLVCSRSALKCIGGTRQGKGGNDRHMLVRSAHEGALAVLLALLGLTPHLRVGLEVFHQRWHVLQGLERALQQVVALTGAAKAQVLIPGDLAVDVPPQVAANLVEVVGGGGDGNMRDGRDGIDELLPRV